MSRLSHRLFVCGMVSLAMALALLVGCSQSSVETGQRRTYERLAGTVTMADYMSLRYSSFNTFAKGIASGANPPQSLRLHVTGGVDGYVYDQDTMRTTWDTLCAVRIDMDNRTKTSRPGEAMSFSFEWDGELMVFPFYTNKYAQFTKGELLPVVAEDQPIVSQLVEVLTPMVKEVPQADELEREGGYYLWDANGDGKVERIGLEQINNGDEARDVMVLTLYDGDRPTSCSIEGAYGVERMEGLVDEEGPYVRISYYAGDFWSHDHVEQATLRLADGELTLQEQ